MGALTIQEIGFAGTAPNFATDTPTTSDTVDMTAGGRTFVVYKNTNAASRTVDIQLPADETPYTENTQGTVRYTVAANTGEVWIPIHHDYIGGNSLVTLLLSATAGVTVAAVRANWTVD